jgi:vacuolar protein sorting-associated protein 13A/C
LVPKSAIDYAWDYPAAREKKVLLTINESRRPVDILEIGNLMPFRFHVCLDMALKEPL